MAISIPITCSCYPPATESRSAAGAASSALLPRHLGQNVRTSQADADATNCEEHSQEWLWHKGTDHSTLLRQILRARRANGKTRREILRFARDDGADWLARGGGGGGGVLGGGFVHA